LIALLVSVLISLWCWWATGAGLGLFLGTTLLMAILLPSMVLAADGIGRLAMLAAAVCGMSLTWLAATQWADVTPLEWIRCTIVLGAMAWGIAGVVSLLVAARLPGSLAAGLTVVIDLLWLTWPVWLSHALTQPLVNWLVPANPCFAINSVLKHLGTWDRAPLAYNTLTILNQDVAYRLPTTIWPATLLHLVIGAPGMWLALRDKPRPPDAATATAAPPAPN